MIRRLLVPLLVWGVVAGITDVARGAVVMPLRVAIDSHAQVASAARSAHRDGVVILQPWEVGELYALKAANPRVRVLMYKDASGAASVAAADGRYPSGVSYREALAHGWLLSNTSGSGFAFNDFPSVYAADIGLPAYQNAWASNVLGELTSAPWDGVFMDDVNPTIRWHYCVPCVAKYPWDALYGGAMRAFLADVGPRIRAAGKLAVANICCWPAYPAEADGWLQYLSGAMDEEFLKWSNYAGQGYQAPATWAEQLQEVKSAEAAGKLFLAVTHSSNTDESAALYGYATALLGGEGRTMFYMGGDYTNETWFPEYDYRIGSPLGPEHAEATGVHRRAFAHGLVLVNPTLETRVVRLGGAYSGSGLTRVTIATMAPQTGLVLMRSRISRSRCRAGRACVRTRRRAS